jgi:hypothetical protein
MTFMRTRSLAQARHAKYKVTAGYLSALLYFCSLLGSISYGSALFAAENKVIDNQYDQFIGIGVGRSFATVGIRYDLEITHPSLRVSVNAGTGNSIGLRYRECKKDLITCISGIYYVGTCPNKAKNTENKFELESCASFGVEYETYLGPQWTLDVGLHAIHFFSDTETASLYPNRYGNLSLGIMRRF